MCLETKEIAAPAYSCLDLTILTWLCVAGWVYLLRLDKQEVSFRLPMPNDDLICSLYLATIPSHMPYEYLSDANVDAPDCWLMRV